MTPKTIQSQLLLREFLPRLVLVLVLIEEIPAALGSCSGSWRGRAPRVGLGCAGTILARQRVGGIADPVRSAILRMRCGRHHCTGMRGNITGNASRRPVEPSVAIGIKMRGREDRIKIRGHEDRIEIRGHKVTRTESRYRVAKTESGSARARTESRHAVTSARRQNRDKRS
jgi:hypothetical protein